MKSALAVGDPITVLIGANVFYGVLQKLSSATTFVVAFGNDANSPWVEYVHNEGILWCRGHDSTDTKALIAACALAQGY